MKKLITLICFAFIYNTTLFSQSKQELYDKASDYFDQESFEKALTTINLALSLDSTNSEYLLLKGTIFEETKNYQEAFNIYSKIIALYPNESNAYNRRGVLLLSIQETENAIKDFTTALSFETIDNDRLNLLLNRGASKIYIRDFNGAYNDLISAYNIDSLNIGVLNNLASVCDEVGKGDKTLEYLYKIIKIDSNFIGAYVNIGFKYQEMGDYKTAIKFFDKVLSIDPNEALSFSNRSFNKYKLGDLDGALVDITKSISLYSSNSYAYRNRALIYIAQNKVKEACVDLEEARSLGFLEIYGDEVDVLKAINCK